MKRTGNAKCGIGNDGARRVLRNPHSGFSLLEMIVATTISGMVALAVVTSMRIGLRAWEKEQQVVTELRRTTAVQDIVQFQIANYVLRQFITELPDRRQPMQFFFGESDRLVFLSAHSALQRGRGGVVAADYFCEQGDDGEYSLYLDERPAPDAESLSDYVIALESTEQGFRPLLRPFQRDRALLLWPGLRTCGFQYWRPVPLPAEWVPEWSLFTSASMPSAITLQAYGDSRKWRGVLPVPVFVRLSMAGVTR